MLKAVLFDMDGVIIDSEIVHTQANLKTLADFHITPPEHYLDQYFGTTVDKMFLKIIDDFSLPTTLEEISAINLAYCKEIFKEYGMTPIDGAIPLIKRLYENGLSLAIASSSSLTRIEEVCDAFEIRSYFSSLVSGCDLPASKPAPDIFLKAARSLQVLPEECLVIEDSHNGCLAAKAANMPCIGFISPHSGNQDLYSATLVTDDLNALEIEDFHTANCRFFHQPITIFEGADYYLREFQKSDANAYLSLRSMPEMRHYMPDEDAYLTFKEKEEKFYSYVDYVYSFYGYGLWGVFEKASNQLIGCCGLEPKEEVMLSYMIAPSHQGKGYATKICKKILQLANRKYRLSNVFAVIDERNAASVQVAKKLGMHFNKKIQQEHQTCCIYSIDFSKKEPHTAARQVLEQYQKNPDTSVYGKRYHKR